ncbi:MAG TPA: TonB-dependent receptor [Puia sp.]|nr:TonB-dependent receptor [Puia sp.]
MRLFILLIANLTFCLAVRPCIAQKKDLLSRAYQPDQKKATVKSFLNDINAKTGVVIEFSSNNIDLEKVIETDNKQKSIGQVLQKILEGQKIRLLEKNNKLILAPSSEIINTDDLVPSYVVYGFVKENDSKEPMIDATIMESGKQKAVITNAHGYFSFSLPEGDHELLVSYVGYAQKKIELSLHSNTRLDFELAPHAIMQEIYVTTDDNLKKNGSDKIPDANGDNYNYFLGENDPVRSAYTLPGVLNVSQNLSSMLVRGGGPDENLFLMDGTQVYNPSHMLGALSIVNQTALKSMQFFKNDFPAKYSGSLSSVMDVYTKDGNMKTWQGEANAGILSGSLTVEGPIVKNKTAVMASFRHSWPSPLWNQSQINIQPDFYDVDAKLTQLINKNNKLMLNFYNGLDKINQTSSNTDNLHEWGNTLGSVGWNHLFGAKSFINISADYSKYHNLGGYKYSLLNDEEETVQTRSLGTMSSIEHYKAKLQAEIYITNKTRLNTGAEYKHSIVKPFETKITQHLEDNKSGFTSFTPLAFDEISGYGELEWKPLSRMVIRPGFHLSEYMFDSYANLSFQPRFFISYKINHKNNLFASYNQMTQFLHLVTNPYVGLNADFWVPSTAALLPERSESYNLGYSFNNRKGLLFSVTGYYKSLVNVTNYANGATLFINQNNWEQNIESGKGWSYGVESILQWSSNKIALHISYTLSWSWRQFADINNGNKFPYKYDRRHVLNAGAVIHISKRFDVSGLWSFSTGDAVSLPDYIYPDYNAAQQETNPDDLLKNYRFLYQFTGTNQYRAANNQRLDAALSYHSLNEKRLQLLITAGVYNITGSPDQYSYDLLGSLTTKNILIQNNIVNYMMIPYLSVTLKF